MFGSFLTIAPGLRIFEDIICRHYYDDIKGAGHISLTGDIDEEFCKGDEVQEELAIVMGGMGFTDSVPGNGAQLGTCKEQIFLLGLIFAFPYGILADR